MIKVKVKDSQNIMDLTIQYYGSMEGLPLMLEDNGLKPDDIIEKGTEILIQEDKVIDKTVLSILSRDNLIVATGDTPDGDNYLITETGAFIVDENENYIAWR